MIRLLVAVVLLVTLAACGGAPATTSAQSTLAAFKAVGLGVENVKLGERAEGPPLPNTYNEHLT